MSDALPFIDEHRITIDAPLDVVWPVLRRYATSIGIGERNPLKLVWAADPPSGFEVAGEAPPTSITLSGRHRFSRYLLEFTLTEPHAGTTVPTARSSAEFPKLHGRVYRALVVGSHAHVLATRAILRSVKKKVEIRA